MRVLSLLFAIMATTAQSEVILAARTIRAHSVLTESDLKVSPGDIVGTYVAVDELIGQETRVVLYAGRPIRINDIGPPALVDRNQIVMLIYHVGGLEIVAEGRSLARGGVGDRIRVMNLTSRATVTGTVQPDGAVSVAPPKFRGS